MKKLFLSIFLMYNLIGFAQSLNFSDIEYINPNEAASRRPRICLVNGEPLVMFTKNSNSEKIVVNKKEGGVWLGENIISEEGVNFQSGTRIGPAIASFGEIVYVAYILESSPSQVVYQKSVDGGLNFSEYEVAYELGDELAEGIDVLVLPDGNPVIAFIHYEPGWFNAQQVVVRSYDQGFSFTDLITIDDSPCECCTPSLFMSDSIYGVSYRDNDFNIRTFKLRVSVNESADFTETIETDLTNWEVNMCPVSSSDGFIVGDTLYSTWMSRPSSINEVFMSRTHIGNQEVVDWSPVDSSEDYGSQNHPKMDGNSNTQVVVWEENRETKYDIFGVVIQNGVYEPSFSFTLGDSIEHKENPDLIYDEVLDLFHLVYRNKGENAVVYRTLEPSGLNLEELNSNLLHVYPNPATTEIRFDLNDSFEEADYKITNSLGELVLSGKLKGAIAIENLRVGTYHIEVFGKSGIYSSLFVKE